jgi:hypothetical protein
VVRVALLDDADKSFAGDRINAFALRVVINIVARSSHRDSGNFLAGIGIKHHYKRRSASDNEQPLIVFIKRHWIVCFDSVEPPLGQLAGLAVDNVHHAPVVWDIDENARPLLF